MAKAAWCNTAPTSGTGDASFSISAGAHTGRSARTTTVTVQNQSGTKPSKTIAVSQVAAALSLTKTTAGTDFPLPTAGGNVVIAGKSNSAYLGITQGAGGAILLLPSTLVSLKINGVAMELVKADANAKLYTITGDPGATAEYTYEWTIKVAANTSAKPRVMNLSVRNGVNQLADGGIAVAFTITTAAAASTLSVAKDSISLVTAGTAQSVAVTSNDDWKVS